ncbi:MAG: hypothetical protein V1875_06520 [Candidatus Altiarchaeota archaeon]
MNRIFDGSTRGGGGDETQPGAPTGRIEKPSPAEAAMLDVVMAKLTGKRVQVAVNIEATARWKVGQMSKSQKNMEGYLEPGETRARLFLITDNNRRIESVTENAPAIDMTKQQACDVGVILKPGKGFSILHEDGLPKELVADMQSIGIRLEKRTIKK